MRMALRHAFVRPLLCGALGLVLASLAACVEEADDKPTPEDLDAIKKNLLTAAPSPKYPANVDFDGKVVYLGLDVEPAPPIEVNRDVRLVHYWKVIAPTGDGWRLFVHGSGANQQGHYNFDHGPIGNKYPVTQWKAGEIIRDEHFIRLPGNFTSDALEIWVGLWKGGQRMTPNSPKGLGGRLLAASLPVKGAAPPPQPKRLIVRKVAKPLKVDGELNEPAWKDAVSTGAFVNTMSGAGVPHKTEAKLLWDNTTLYIGAELEDADVWANMGKRDDKLWQEEAFEVMIDANGDGKSYIELQVNPKGTVFDTYLPTYRKYEDSLDPKRKPYSWDAKVKVAVKVNGTLNKREDTDKGWTLEVALPLADANGLAKAGEGAVKVPPTVGDTWKVNFFRLEVAKSGAQEASGWSPPMVGDFHALAKFGEIVFGDETGAIVPPPSKVEAAAKGEPAKAGENAETAKARKAAYQEKINRAIAPMREARSAEKAAGAPEVVRPKPSAPN